jgi:hypothetical protein
VTAGSIAAAWRAGSHTVAVATSRIPIAVIAVTAAIDTSRTAAAAAIRRCS